MSSSYISSDSEDEIFVYTKIDLTGVTITKIEMINYAHPSDWQGNLSNGKRFYSRYRNGLFSFFVHDIDHTINIFYDDPFICLDLDSKELRDALDGDVLSESNMLKLCNLTLSPDCLVINIPMEY